MLLNFRDELQPRYHEVIPCLTVDSLKEIPGEVDNLYASVLGGIRFEEVKSGVCAAVIDEYEFECFGDCGDGLCDSLNEKG